METYVAISLFACLYKMSVFLFKGYFILQSSVHVCSFSGAVNMVKFAYPYLTSAKAVLNTV